MTLLPRVWLTTRRRMSLVGALQGAALWAIYEGWVDSQPLAALLLGLGFFIAASALVIHIARSGSRSDRLVLLALGTGAIFGIVSFWVGWQIPAEDAPYDGDDTRLGSWTLLSMAALYAAMPFLQIYQRSGRLEFQYPDLYRFSWGNFFVASLAVLYTIALWIVLLLWGALFDLIGIEFFQDTFAEPFFIFVVSAVALGYGVAAALESQHVIDTLRDLVRTLFQAVFPLLAAVTLAFLASVPFTGLHPLFDTRHAASILVWWMAMGVLFLNAVYVDGRAAPPYARSLRRLAEIGTLALPLLGGIALYALALRIDQYGLTPRRIYALVAAFVLLLYTLGYAVAVIRGGEPWLPTLQRVNRSLAFVVMALCLALHTPLLDPLDWSLRSQLDRLARGEADPESFDYGFLRFHLGQQGYEALRRLEGEAAEGSAAKRRIELALAVENRWLWRSSQPIAMQDQPLAALDGKTAIPTALIAALAAWAQSYQDFAKCGDPHPCMAFQADILRGGALEWIILPPEGAWPRLPVFTRDESRGEDSWRSAGSLFGGESANTWREKRLPRLQAGDFEAAAPKFDDLLIGEHRYEFQPGH